MHKIRSIRELVMNLPMLVPVLFYVLLMKKKNYKHIFLFAFIIQALKLLLIFAATKQQNRYRASEQDNVEKSARFNSRRFHVFFVISLRCSHIHSITKQLQHCENERVPCKLSLSFRHNNTLSLPCLL